MRTRPQARPGRRSRRKASLDVAAHEAALEALSPQEARERLLEQLSQDSGLCQEIQSLLQKHPGPELEAIMQLHRVLVLKLSAEAQAAPELLGLVNTLMKPLIDWARLEETRKQRELAEKKYRDEQASQQAARAREQRGPEQALQPETLKKIERELNLF
jgi:hypothetical protein